MVQLGLREQVLSSRTIWLCAGCETCATRCPNDIQIVKLMDALRQMALRERIQPREPAVAAFHRTFLEGIRRWGRQYELGMMLVLKVRTRDLFSDIGLGLRMLLKGKLALLPHRSHASKEMKAIFDRSEEG
jgi:heterodisulfide reductase subunit C